MTKKRTSRTFTSAIVENNINIDKACLLTKKNVLFYRMKKIKDLQEENNVLKYHLLEKISNENDFLKKQMEEKNKQINDLIPKVGNNKFNINIFLNEKCKNALSLRDFIDNIEITAQALSLTKDEGLTTGLSHLIMENMNKLALHERPIHCSDKKTGSIVH